MSTTGEKMTQGRKVLKAVEERVGLGGVRMIHTGELLDIAAGFSAAIYEMDRLRDEGRKASCAPLWGDRVPSYEEVRAWLTGLKMPPQAGGWVGAMWVLLDHIAKIDHVAKHHREAGMYLVDFGGDDPRVWRWDSRYWRTRDGSAVMDDVRTMKVLQRVDGFAPGRHWGI